MGNDSVFNPLGSSIEAGEIAAGAISFDKLGTDLYKMKLLEVVTATADTSITSGTLPSGYDFFEVHLTFLASASLQFIVRFNADTGNNYDYKRVNSTSWALTSAATNMYVGDAPTDRQFRAVLKLDAVCAAIANGEVGVNIAVEGAPTANGIYGNWVGGNAQAIESIQILPTSAIAFTGKMYIFGGKYQ